MAAQKIAARTHCSALGQPAAACASALRKRPAAPMSSAPVTPLPIAASVSATSIAARRTHTSASSIPKETNATTAEKAVRATMAATATAITSRARMQSNAPESVVTAAYPVLAARAINCATVAPLTRTRSQTATSFNAASTLPVCGTRPRTMRPRPRLSAFVSACRRVNMSGKRSRPTVPARRRMRRQRPPLP